MLLISLLTFQILELKLQLNQMLKNEEIQEIKNSNISYQYANF